MAVHYQVRLKGTDGLVKAIFEDTGGFLSLRYSHRVNGISAFELELRGDDPRISLFVADAQVEIWRRHQLLDMDWYPEFEGLVRAPVAKVPRGDAQTFSANGQSYTDFLRRRVIAYTQGSVGAAKSAPAETAMKAYVKENLGSLATLGNGRKSAGVMTGLAVQTDVALGSTWTGDRSYEKLLKVLQEIASASGLDFDVIGTGAGLFEFRTYVGQRGTDRSTLGLDTFTARNGVGNTPVIFSIENETMVDVVYSLNRMDEVNRFFILGQGQGSIRQISVSGIGNTDGVLGAGHGEAAPSMGAGGIGDGRSAFSFTGGQYVNVFSPVLAAAFNGAKGWLLQWVRITDAAVWADGVSRTFLFLRADANNYVALFKNTTVNQVGFVYDAGGTIEAVLDTSLAASTAWFLVGITWDKVADQIKAYINGAQVGSTQTTLGTWAGSLAATTCVLGGTNTTPTEPHKGLLAHGAVGAGRVLTAAEIAAVYAAQTGDMRGTIMALGPTAYWMLDDDTGTVAVSETSDDASFQDDSPWNLCEDSRNAVREGDVTSLPLVGSAALAQAKIRKEFSFKVLQQPQQLYGKHYTWGDKVTADFQGVATHLKIVGMTGAFAEGGERIELEFAEVG